MIYLAQPYSHPAPDVVERRVLLGMGAAAALAQMGWNPFAPIVHWHEAATRFNLPTDHKFWGELNFHMLERADQFAILQLPGWNQSAGVAREWVKAEECLLTPFLVRVVVWPREPKRLPTLDIQVTTYRHIEEAFIRGEDDQQRGPDTGEAGGIILG